MSSLEYLESERLKLWEKVVALEEAVNKKTSDYEKEAKQSSRKASEFRNRSEEAKIHSVGYLEEIKSRLTEVKRNHTLSTSFVRKIEELQTESDKACKIITNNNIEITERKTEIDGYLTDLEKLFKNYTEFSEKISKLETINKSSVELSSKIETVYKSLLSRKKEIDELYIEIFGFNEVDKETGEEERITGLKTKLENAFNSLKLDIQNAENDLELYKVDSKNELSKFIENTEKQYTQVQSKWENKYKDIYKQIEELLPNALTTGLSYAYSDKKKNEEIESKKLFNRFKWGIIGMTLVSLIPLSVSLKSFVDGVPLEDVIIRMPRLVFSILPLYIPALWVAYSSNKKLNLSKRLIEEYTHKEVLSKTFEGLAKQINDIEDYDVSSDLKNKLLYNILEVSSENPGKLISDYNKSDHPLMDALDKSVKLANAVDKLSQVPGLSKLTTLLDIKAKKVLDDVSSDVEEGVEVLKSNQKTQNE